MRVHLNAGKFVCVACLIVVLVKNVESFKKKKKLALGGAVVGGLAKLKLVTLAGLGAATTGGGLTANKGYPAGNGPYGSGFYGYSAPGYKHSFHPTAGGGYHYGQPYSGGYGSVGATSGYGSAGHHGHVYSGGYSSSGYQGFAHSGGHHGKIDFGQRSYVAYPIQAFDAYGAGRGFGSGRVPSPAYGVTGAGGGGSGYNGGTGGSHDFYSSFSSSFGGYRYQPPRYFLVVYEGRVPLTPEGQQARYISPSTSEHRLAYNVDRFHQSAATSCPKCSLKHKSPLYAGGW